MRRKANKIDWYLMLIAGAWPGFEDDGLTFFPDWIYSRWDLTLAGRVHDWHYCTRCHRHGLMTRKAEKFANRALRQHASELLPWWLPAAPFVLYYGVKIGAHFAWDSCGQDEGKRCRHNMKQPTWMVLPKGA